MTHVQGRLAFHACAATTVVGIWMLTQPYAGLRHDAVLYLAQALKAYRPEQFSQDLFFAFGSQDSYSIYSLIVGPIFARAEIWPTQPIILWLCHAAFLAAIWRLLPSQFNLRQRWLSLAALAVLRPLYGGMSIVGFCEPFLTARSFAEPMALWALVFFLQGRHWIAWLLMLLASAVHPLMSIPAALCLWLLSCARDRRWLAVLLLAIPVAALALLGKPPFDALLKQYPDAWWKLVTQANDQVLVRNWSAPDWASITVDVIILLAAQALLYRPQKRNLIFAVIVGCGFLLAFTVVGSQLYRNELITQLQLWRGLWVVRALSIALTPAVLLAFVRTGLAGTATACSLACLISMANLHWGASWIGMIWPALHLWIWHTRRNVRSFMLRMSISTSVIAMVAIGLFDYLGLRSIPVDDATYMDFSSVGIALIVLPLFVLAILAWVWRAHRMPSLRFSRSGTAYCSLASAALLAVTGAALWDRRPPIIEYLESHLHSPHPFEAFVPSDAAVYWDNSLAAAWFILKRPSYFSAPQGAGLLFNEATAHAWAQRSQAVQSITQRRVSCEIFTILLSKLPTGTPPCLSLPEDEAVLACRSAPALQFLVSGELYSRKPLAIWEVPQGREPFKTQYLYACSAFR